MLQARPVADSEQALRLSEHCRFNPWKELAPRLLIEITAFLEVDAQRRSRWDNNKTH